MYHSIYIRNVECSVLAAAVDVEDMLFNPVLADIAAAHISLEL